MKLLQSLWNLCIRNQFRRKSSNMSTGKQKSPHFSGGWANFIEMEGPLKNQDFLYRLGHSFWTRGDHGRRSSINLKSLSSMCWGISVSSRLKYSKIFIIFAFAVSTRLYRIALAFAPLEDSIITKFFRPMVKGRIACSAFYTDIRIICGTSNSSILYW